MKTTTVLKVNFYICTFRVNIYMSNTEQRQAHPDKGVGECTSEDVAIHSIKQATCRITNRYSSKIFETPNKVGTVFYI